MGDTRHGYPKDDTFVAEGEHPYDFVVMRIFSRKVYAILAAQVISVVVFAQCIFRWKAASTFISGNDWLSPLSAGIETTSLLFLLFSPWSASSETQVLDEESLLKKNTSVRYYESGRRQQIVYFIYTLAYAYQFTRLSLLNEDFDARFKALIISSMIVFLITETVCDTRVGENVQLIISKKVLVLWITSILLGTVFFVISIYKNIVCSLAYNIWSTLFLGLYPIFIFASILRNFGPIKGCPDTVFLFICIITIFPPFLKWIK
ncbi:hypothetical protein KAFR_0A00130 [Kazachstania africana CBS 2517]|uniref:Uncharacterized protein n=1 Tax=Kazachstania africana (strain ATCC 22294 / BCRC 22015 / CBS 2517 / CECT 1963 / NBRC 1671 / NRRL Y-8276) TaxID=1071382 RepID=H2AM51_KAZAF|nr:hypothetical protein KAFR_0A00130 [Kazachstania africana CBS 2517]CCF55451.1 hypothetical protein KAFR_0A00130 [Kazachstania africana CBS 2517]